MIPVLGRFLNYLRKAPEVELVDPVDETDKTEFGDVQRRLKIYLRALWDCDFPVRRAVFDPDSGEERRPYIEYGAICLPEAFYDGGSVNALDTYRAAAAHAAAHLMFAQRYFSRRSLSKWQIAVISAIEDARIETLAHQSFPGLKRLWIKQHGAGPQDSQTAGDYLNRLSRALLDEHYRDDDEWVTYGRRRFLEAGDLTRENFARELGLTLADAFRGKVKFDARAGQAAPYRDDNRALWTRPGKPFEVINPYMRSRKATVGVEEEGAKRESRTDMELLVAEDEKPSYGTFNYPEWNYRTRTEDAGWVTLREREPPLGELSTISGIIADNERLISRMKSLLRAIREGAVHRVRKLEDGDEMDINAAIRAQVDLRCALPPDSRIMMRMAHRNRDISVLMLLDLSRSMNDQVKNREVTAIQLTQQVSTLFAEAIEAVADPFAIHGFYSDSRHYVDYLRFKDFGQPYDDAARSRMAGMKGWRGTRMGAAIRHATHLLDEQKSGRKVLLIISDGEPADMDAPDRRYLHDDAKKSVEDARRHGIHPYCITLDPAADWYVSRIFGASNYMIVDHIKSLPEKVLLIYAGLTR